MILISGQSRYTSLKEAQHDQQDQPELGVRQECWIEFPVPPPPTPSSNNLIDTFEGCASISDAGGTLILYTDGQKVWDGGGNVRAQSLQGHPSSTQSAIIVPNPGNAAQYYIFTTNGQPESGVGHHVDGILIDTSSWAVTQLSSFMTMPPTTGYSPTEKLTAIQGVNCKYCWVVTIIQKAPIEAKVGRGILRVFRVDSAGVTWFSDTPMGVDVEDIGYLKGSRDSKRIAIANWHQRNVLVYSFDQSAGTIDLSSLINITVPPVHGQPADYPLVPYGVEFSPNGNILYYTVVGGVSSSSMSTGYVYQHDLFNPSTFQAWNHPNQQGHDQPGRYALGALQLGMDDRIYIAQDGEQALGVIANPDVLGPGCNLTFSSLALAPGSKCYMGLPNLIPNPCEFACDEGNCGEAVDVANQILNTRADTKFNTIIASGQGASTECVPAFEQTNFAPRFSLHWGDGPSDQFESHDTEIIYIRVRNPFANLIYRGVKIFNIQITPNHTHPSGEDALQLIPAVIACFDEIEPCSYVSRDFAFLIQNADVNTYHITFDYCIDEIAICGGHDGKVDFAVDVVAS